MAEWITHQPPVNARSGEYQLTAEFDDTNNRRWRVSGVWIGQGARPEPRSIEITGLSSPLTAEAIRRLPLGTVLREMQRVAAAGYASAADGVMPEGWEDDDELGEPGDFAPLFEVPAHYWNSVRGRARPAALLEHVAHVYRNAYAARLPVTRAVADATNCSPSTAGKRIMAARKAGLLEGVGE